MTRMGSRQQPHSQITFTGTVWVWEWDAAACRLLSNTALSLHTHTHTCTYIYTNSLCPLQVTIQACDIDEARFLYDQLAVVGPVIVSSNDD